MSYAIIETGGKQYRVAPGDVISVEKLDAQEGSEIDFNRVLLVSNDSGIQVGKPTVEGVKVIARVNAQARGDKVIVFKYKPKTRYRVKTGHRQSLTQVTISEIHSGSSTNNKVTDTRSKKPNQPNKAPRIRRTSDGT